MIIGIPKEIKIAESRVSLLPDACADLVSLGHEVIVEQNAGVMSGYDDQEYINAGCVIKSNINAIYQNANLIVKVKEPQSAEFPLLNDRHIIFSYLHLAAENLLVKTLIESEVTAIAFEGVTDDVGSLPLLRPMSLIAGTLAGQYASILLHQNNGGRGMLVGGIENVNGASVTILGYGSVGSAAAKYFVEVGANITVIDKSPNKLELANKLGTNVTTLISSPESIEQTISNSDVVIGAVLIPGARAPVIVKRAWVSNMPTGAVIVDIAVDQGGCIETTKPTTYDDPTYIEEGVVHFAVKNIPAAVPRTASQALSQAILPVVKKIADGTWQNDKNILAGLSVQNGQML